MGLAVDRFSTPLYAIAEAAGYLAVPASTFSTWAYGYERKRSGGELFTARPVMTVEVASKSRSPGSSRR